MRRITSKKSGRVVVFLGIVVATYLMHLYLWVWERLKKRTIFEAY
jgi:hypothetical protein